MKLLNGFLLAISTVIFINTAFAKTAAYYESVLTPGARLVMGKEKNEFYIIGPRESVVNQAPVNNSYTMKAKKTLPHANILAAKTISHAPINSHPVRMAAYTPIKRFTPIAANRFGLSKLAKAGNNARIAKIDHALQVASLHARKQESTNIKKSLAVSIKTAMLSKKAEALMIPHPFKSDAAGRHHHHHLPLQAAHKKRIMKTRLAFNH